MSLERFMHDMGHGIVLYRVFFCREVFFLVGRLDFHVISCRIHGTPNGGSASVVYLLFVSYEGVLARDDEETFSRAYSDIEDEWNELDVNCTQNKEKEIEDR